ncbi:MAG TPA: hypothetical protein VFN76_05975 [Candidatus Limnocylindria bacterium]|nr:hypothetical protein [Candidatus Limnocylindria bacterium]
MRDFLTTVRFVRRRLGEIADERRTRARALPAGPRPIDGISGRITARRAVDLAEALVAPLDDERRLVGIVSDTNIDAAGRSVGWDLFYDLPGRESALNVIISACPDAAPVDDPPLCGELRETPWLRDHADPAFVRKIAAELGMTPEQWDAKRRELAMADRKTPLPVPFRDSPEAVAELSTKGIDFVSGPTDIALGTARLKDGSVVWEVQAGGRKARTAFVESPT